MQPQLGSCQTLSESRPKAAVTHQHRNTQSTTRVHPPVRPMPSFAILKLEIQTNIYQVLPSPMLQFHVSFSLAIFACNLSKINRQTKVNGLNTCLGMLSGGPSVLNGNSTLEKHYILRGVEEVLYFLQWSLFESFCVLVGAN